MISLVFSFSLLLLAQQTPRYPHVNPFDEEISQSELSVQSEQAVINRYQLMRLALVAGEGDQVPELIVVLVNTREIMEIFPSGNLPADPLQPNTIYEVEPGSARRGSYLTLYQWSSGEPKFAVFAREAEP